MYCMGVTVVRTLFFFLERGGQTFLSEEQNRHSYLRRNMRGIKGIGVGVPAQKHKEIEGRFGRLTRAIIVSTPMGGWISSLRKAYSLSRKQLGALAGLTDKEIEKLERGEIGEYASLKSLRRLGNVLGLSFVYGFIPDGTPEKFDAELKGRLSDLFDDYEDDRPDKKIEYSGGVQFKYECDSFIMGAF